jgi:hypothetical protein
MVVIDRDLEKEYKRIMEDNVNNPLHYNQKNIEAICAIEASMDEEEFRGYLKGNTLKYTWRYKNKGKPVEDLEKAQYYLNLLIKKAKEHYGSTSESS